MALRTVPTIIGVTLLALVVTVIGLVVQWQRAGEAEERARAAEERAERLAEQVAELEDTVAHLRAERETDEPDEPDEPLRGLLGDDGPLGELLADGVPGAACLTPRGGGLLDGLLDAREPLPDEPDALVEVVAEQVADLRELAWEEPVEVDFVGDAELSERLGHLLDEDLDPAELAARQRLLVALGAVPGDLDLDAVQRELLDEQVAGYYLPDSGELVVRVPEDDSIRALDKITLAHELEHALADQVLGLPEVAHDAEAGDDDAQLGALALVEGDATLLMHRWALAHLSLGDQLAGAMGGELEAAQASLAAVPHHLQRELLFPYTEGLAYVCELYLDGGWAEVDARYADPPATSLEVLFPDRDGEEPASPAELAAPDGGEQLLATTFGAAPLLWLFEAPGQATDRALEDARAQVASWGGGEVEVWDLDGEVALGLALVDREADGSLCEALGAWHAAAFVEHEGARHEQVTVFRGDQRSAALRCEGGDVRYASAPRLTTALRIVGVG